MKKPVFNKQRRGKLIEENDVFLRLWMKTIGDVDFVASFFDLSKEQVIRKYFYAKKKHPIVRLPKPNKGKVTVRINEE